MVAAFVKTQLSPLEEADRLFDQAWVAGGDMACALADAKRLSGCVGRDPVIEDAKLQLAEANSCTPSEAFALLVKMSQSMNRKVAAIARQLVDQAQDH
jgi:AmiR/NasT family two-component response regulator